jgi:hypothetical protein
MAGSSKVIDWERLFREFDRFEPDEGLCEWNASLFAHSLLQPVPGFVHAFLHRKHLETVSDDEAVRALYSFLLEKRYEEKLNLLHFAFNIFDETTQLPREVIDRTPFPHEEGIPRFTHINDPSFVVELKPQH